MTEFIGVFIQPTNLIIATLAIFVVAAFFWIQRSDSPKRAGKRRVFYFSKAGEVMESEAEDLQGALLPPDLGGGIVEQDNRAIFLYYGRQWRAYADPMRWLMSRRRVPVFVAKEGDPAPLNMPFGSHEDGFAGDQISRNQYTQIEDINSRLAAAEALEEGPAGDLVARRLSLAVFLAVLTALGVWITAAVKGSI